jgi:hypothetical protein
MRRGSATSHVAPTTQSSSSVSGTWCVRVAGLLQSQTCPSLLTQAVAMVVAATFCITSAGLVSNPGILNTFAVHRSTPAVSCGASCLLLHTGGYRPHVPVLPGLVHPAVCAQHTGEALCSGCQAPHQQASGQHPSIAPLQQTTDW